MAIVLGTNQYGKAEKRLVGIYRDSARWRTPRCAVTRDGAPDPGPAWDAPATFC
jgi:hypothetical protein